MGVVQKQMARKLLNPYSSNHTPKDDTPYFPYNARIAVIPGSQFIDFKQDPSQLCRTSRDLSHI
jgi:hypothetical protein